MLPKDVILQFQGLGFLGAKAFQQVLFDSVVCLMRTILRSKVLLPLGPCYFTCPAEMQSQSTDQGIKGKHGYRSMICTLHFVKTKVQIKESNEIQGTDHHHQVAADLYFGFH